MNPLFYKLNTRDNVIFTKHCKQRLLQRFKLFLLSFERENPEIYLKKDFKTSKVNMPDFLCPGYMNQIESKHGKNSFISRSDNLVYFCRFDEKTNQIIVKSIVKNNGNIYI